VRLSTILAIKEVAKKPEKDDNIAKASAVVCWQRAASSFFAR
jgi:hypothetical protein